MLCLRILIAILVVFLFIYFYFKYKFTYWIRKGVPQVEPVFPYGNIKEYLLGRENMNLPSWRIYKTARAQGHKYMGFYMLSTEMLCIADPQLVKYVLLRDFTYFQNRGIYHDEVNDPLGAHLVSLESEKWKNLRKKLTPAFTSSKIKSLTELMIECGEGLKDVLNGYVERKEVVKISDVMSLFTTDVIGSCAFGIECNSLKYPNSEFLQYGRRATHATYWDTVKSTMARAMPGFFKLSKLRIIDRKVSNFFLDVLANTVQYRERCGTARNDFLQLLIELKNSKCLDDDSQRLLTMNELMAQAYVFFIAGYETSATVLNYCIYELCLHPEIQQKVHKEIVEVLEETDGKITYDGLAKMQYMEQTISETLWKYPVVGLVPRKCTMDYRIPGTDVTIERGTTIIIPMLGLHRDEEYYPNPEKFDPDRFNSKNCSKIKEFTYIPFSEGPRNCIGMRFAIMVIKVALAVMFTSFRFKLNPRTRIPPSLHAGSFMLTIDDGIWIDVFKVQHL